MCSIWLYASAIKIPAEIVKEHLRLPAEAVVTEKIFRLVSVEPFILLTVQPVLASEVREHYRDPPSFLKSYLPLQVLNGNLLCKPDSIH